MPPVLTPSLGGFRASLGAQVIACASFPGVTSTHSQWRRLCRLFEGGLAGGSFEDYRWTGVFTLCDTVGHIKGMPYSPRKQLLTIFASTDAEIYCMGWSGTLPMRKLEGVRVTISRARTREPYRASTQSAASQERLYRRCLLGIISECDTRWRR
ncbi:hypothetical protein H4582DRAFT_1540177 [Lactarius indigo]|nr:hypothetical protein H4582DRAFT_1540177 [Lactarius indigo]